MGRERERERVRLMWVFATICGYLLRRLVFATVANTEGRYLSRKVGICHRSIHAF